MLVFAERGKPEYPEKNLSEQRREPTTNSTDIWRRVRKSNPGYIGERRVLSPLHHPCSPETELQALLSTHIYIFLSFRYVIEYKANKGIIGWIHVVFQSNHSGLFRWSLLFVSTKKFYRSLQITYRQPRCKQYYLVRLTPVLPSLGIPITPCQVAADVWPFVLKKRQNPIRNPHALNVFLNVSSSTRFSTALFFPSLITTSSKQMPLVFLSPKAHI